MLMMICDALWPSVNLLSLKVVLLRTATGPRLLAVTSTLLNGSCAKNVGHLLGSKKETVLQV